jgi:hypothetical protein
MDAQKVVESIGQVIGRNLRLLPDDREARKAFNEYVLEVANGGAPADLSEAQLRVLQSYDRRGIDCVPKEVSDALGIVEGKTYRDAINLCERHATERAKDEKQTVSANKIIDKRVAHRRHTDK